MLYKEHFILSMAFTGIATLILGFFVCLRNIRNKLHIVFSLYCLSIAWWSLSQIGTICGPSVETSWFWSRFEHIGVVFIPTFFLHFIILFLKLKDKKWMLVISYILSIFFALTIPSKLLVSHVTPKLGGMINYGNPGPFYTPLVIFFVSSISYCLWELLLAYRGATETRRNQLKYLWWSSLIGYIGGSANYFLVYNINIPILNPFGTYLVGIGQIGVGYAIIKYRLMDITVLAVRTLIFIVVYGILLVVPLVTFFNSRAILGDILSGPRWWLLPSSIGAYALLALLAPFIYIFLQRRAENIIRAEEHRYQQAITNLTKSIVEIRDIGKLLDIETSTIAKEVRVSFCVMYIKVDDYKSFQLKSCDPSQVKSRFPELISYDSSLIATLNAHNKPLLSEEVGQQDKIHFDSGLIIPCFGKDGLLSIIILGAKPNKQMYTDNDLLTFETLSYATSLAIENCTYWKEIEDRQRKARLQEMDTFSYSLAHEIDNPMTFVRNLARFLKEHFLKYITEPEERKEVEELCNIIMEGSERVMGMVKAIRQFGQKTTGELEPLNLQEVIEGFFKLYSPELKANFILFSKEMPDEAIYVKGVAAELQQVLIIFSKNAIHAMKYAQEKKMTLRVTKLNHSTVRIAVSDAGYGIRKENLETIFAPFFTSKASTEGTGMGLHNAKGFVLRHQGRIWAESEGENKGATFIFELPILQDAKPDDLNKKESKTDWAY